MVLANCTANMGASNALRTASRRCQFGMYHCCHFQNLTSDEYGEFSNNLADLPSLTSLLTLEACAKVRDPSGSWLSDMPTNHMGHLLPLYVFNGFGGAFIEERTPKKRVSPWRQLGDLSMY